MAHSTTTFEFEHFKKENLADSGGTREERKALLDVGIAIRRRLFEHERAKLKGIGERKDLAEFKDLEIDQKAIKRGDCAAHRANMKADAALAAFGFLNNEGDEAVFKELYSWRPDEVKFLSDKMIEFYDMETSLKISRAINNRHIITSWDRLGKKFRESWISLDPINSKAEAVLVELRVVYERAMANAR